MERECGSVLLLPTLLCCGTSALSEAQAELSGGHQDSVQSAEKEVQGGPACSLQLPDRTVQLGEGQGQLPGNKGQDRGTWS